MTEGVYKLLLFIAVGIGLGAFPGFAQSSQTIAFVDVNVVPMTQNNVLPHQTVLVRDSLISSVGPASTAQVPGDAVRVVGHGASYLMPGLADMHTHVATEEDLALFTANGVTTVLHMGEAPAWMVASANPLIDRGEIAGPHILFSLLIDGSPTLEHFFVSTPQEGRDAVDLARTNGYQFVKLYNAITADEFSAIVDEARRVELPVIGHGVRAVGLPEALFEGQVMVAHAEEFFYTAFQNHTDLSKIPDVVAETARSRAFVTPTLSAFEAFSEQWGKPEVAEKWLRDPRARYLSPGARLQWGAHNSYIKRGGSIQEIVPFLKTFTKALSNAGVPLLVGTDSPLPGLFPGYSVHDDIRALIGAGLTPYQSLSAATRVPGEFVEKYVPTAQRFGTVEVGKKADLVLVAGNPLDDVEVLKSPLGVMTAGRWRTAKELAEILDRQAAMYKKVLQ